MKRSQTCENCGKCCLLSQMVLSERERKKILKKYKDLSQFNIFPIGDDGFLRMLTTNRQCVFFDLTTKKCSIYKVRPKGCQIYPIYFNFEEQVCKFGELCPKPREFYPDEKSFRKSCRKLKKYLKKQLLIENIVFS